jgi:hypothetical protein
MDKYNFAIGIPTINQWETLKPFVLNYLINFPLNHIYILDNGNQGIDLEQDITLTIMESETPRSVAASWNFLCRKIFSKPTVTHALILNDDVYLNKKFYEIDKFLKLFGEEPLITCQQGWCSFLISKKTFTSIGGFDENFKGAYFEDKDYERRLKVARLSLMRHGMLNPSIFNESSSIKKNPSLNNNYKANAEYYAEKWGGNQGGEIFTTPFNKNILS